MKSNYERNSAILSAREQAPPESYASIGRRLGLSSEYIRQICSDARRCGGLKQGASGWAEGLPTRTANALRGHGIDSREAAIAFIASLRVGGSKDVAAPRGRPRIGRVLMPSGEMVDNMGRDGLAAARAWAGLAPLPKAEAATANVFDPTAPPVTVAKAIALLRRYGYTVVDPENGGE